jgi:hypothetical protein
MKTKRELLAMTRAERLLYATRELIDAEWKQGLDQYNLPAEKRTRTQIRLDRHAALMRARFILDPNRKKIK